MNTKTRIALLAGVMTMASLVENQAEARRLVPDRPSVEVRLEALRALRSSVSYSQQMQMQQPPFQPSAPAPVMIQPAPVTQAQPYQRKPSIIAEPPIVPTIPPQQQYVPAPVPPKQAVTPVIKTPKEEPPLASVAPKPKPSPEVKPPAPALVDVTPPAPLETPKPSEPVTLESPKVPQVKDAEKPKFTPVPSEKPDLPEKAEAVSENDKNISLPSVEDTKEINAAPAEDVEELLDLSLEDIVEDKPVSTPETESMVDTKTDSMPLDEEAPLTLEDIPETSDTQNDLPDVQESVDESLPVIEQTQPSESLEKLPESEEAEVFQKEADDATSGEALEVESLPEPELDGLNFEELPEDDISGTAPAEDESLEIMAEPVQPEQVVPEEQPESIPDIAEISSEEQATEQLDEEIVEKTPESLTSEMSEDTQPQQQNTISSAEAQPEKKEKKGLFPNISRAITNLFADEKVDDEKNGNLPAGEPQPKSDADKVELTDEAKIPEYTEPQIVDLDEETLGVVEKPASDLTIDEQVTNVPDAPVADVDTMPQNEGLPALPDFATTSSPATTEPMDTGLPPLPDFAKNEAKTDQAEKELDSLPPLPFGNQQQKVTTSSTDEQKTAMLESIDDTDLPSVNDLTLSANPEDVKLSVLFSKSETEVPLSFQQPLIALSKELIDNPSQNVKVIAYASGTDDQKSIAKRISLARALAVRAFLIDLGVENVRISVQALGNDGVGNGSSERADIILVDS